MVMRHTCKVKINRWFIESTFKIAPKVIKNIIYNEFIKS